MTLRDLTKVVFLICLVTVTCIPIAIWALTGRSLTDVAAFVGASAGPMGVLTGAMAYRNVQRDRYSGGHHGSDSQVVTSSTPQTGTVQPAVSTAEPAASAGPTND